MLYNWTIISLVLAAAGVASADYKTAIEKLNKGYNPSVFAMVEEMGFEKGCSVRNLSIFGSDPISGKTRKVFVKEFASVSHTDHSNSRTIVLLPPTGGENTVDRLFAKAFCTDFPARVLIVRDWEQNKEVSVMLGSEDDVAVRTVTAVRHVLEYINENDVGLLATSKGAIVGSVVMAVDKRISHSTLIVGGMGLPEIIAHSHETEMTKLRNKRYQEYNFRDNFEYERALADSISIAPEHFKNEWHHVNAFMVVATKDKRVPTKNQIQLVESLNKPEVVKMARGHVAAVIGSFGNKKIKKRILHHFFPTMPLMH